MSTTTIYLFISIAILCISIQINTVKCDTKYLNYRVYEDVNCNNTILYGSTGFIDNDMRSINQSIALYKSIFNGEELYYLYINSDGLYMVIDSPDDNHSEYPIPMDNTCYLGSNGYYYKFNIGQPMTIYYEPTLVYVTIQSSICDIISTMITLPTYKVPSLLGFIDSKYSLLDVGMELLNVTSNCMECGANQCMDTYRSVYYQDYAVDVQFIHQDKDIVVIKANFCNLFGIHTMQYPYTSIQSSSSLCNTVLSLPNGQQDLVILSKWRTSTMYFPIKERVVTTYYIIPSVVYLTQTIGEIIKFKVNTTFLNANTTIDVSAGIKTGGNSYSILRLYPYGNDEYGFRYYGNAFSFTVFLYLFDIRIPPIVLNVTTWQPNDVFISRVDRTSVTLNSFKCKSIVIGDRKMAIGHDNIYTNTIDSLKPNTTYSIIFSQSYGGFDVVNILNVTTLFGVSIPTIYTTTYDKKDYQDVMEKGRITLSFNAESGSSGGLIAYSVSMNNRFIEHCIQIYDISCTFEPLSPLLINREYKIKIIAYSDGYSNSITQSLIFNGTRDLVIKSRPFQLYTNHQPTVSLSLSTPTPTLTPPNQNNTNTTSQDSTNGYSTTTKCTSYMLLLLILSFII